MKVTPETLRASQDIRDMLWPFDFAVTSNKEYGPVWFDTAPLQPFEIVAQRGSGCVYALTGPQRHVLLATSEGQAGIVAASLKECLELVVTHPYWQDILRLRRRRSVRDARGVARPASTTSRRTRSATIPRSRSFGRCCARGSDWPSRAIR